MQYIYLFTFFLACLLVGKPALAQNYNPAITIMLPEHTTSDKAMRVFIDSINGIIKARLLEVTKQIEIPNDIPLGQKRSMQNFRKFPESLNFSTVVPTALAQELYKEFQEGMQKDSSLIFIVAQKTTDNIDELKKIAEQEQVKYIIGISETHYNFINGEVKMRMKAFLYDHAKGEILYHREYNNEDKVESHKHEKKDIQLNTALNNVCFQFIEEVYQTILPTIPNFKSPQTVEQEREKYLIQNIHEKELNQEILAVIKQEMAQVREELYIFKAEKDTMMEYYQGIFSNDKQKFIAFVWKEQKGTISMSDGEITQMEFDIIAGVFYQNKWYLDVVTKPLSLGYSSFNSVKYDLETAKKLYIANLIIYRFFKEKSAEHDLDFWNRGFFAKVRADYSRDIKSCERSIESYKNGLVSSNVPINVHTSVKRERQRIRRYRLAEKANAKYKGLYEIVVKDSIATPDSWSSSGGKKYNTETEEGWKESRKDEDLKDNFEEGIKKNTFKKFKNIVQYDKENITVFQENKPEWIASYILKDKKGKETLHFFLFDPKSEKVYEWIYFKPETLMPKPTKEEAYKKRHIYDNYIIEIIDKKLMQLTDWLDGEYPVTDEKFWQEYVFKQKNGKYLYLVEVK